MHESYDEDDTDSGWSETGQSITDPRNLTREELRTRIIDRYDVDELVVALELTTMEFLTEDMWDILMERVEYLDVYE